LAVARVGHIRAFAAFAALATLAPLLHAISPAVLVWCALRVVTGLCFAGLYIVIESWLNGAATNENRGAVFSLYTVINLTVMAAGQLLVLTGDPTGFELFSLIAILIALAVIPVALSREATPHQPEAARLRLRWLYETSPVGVVGCLCTGLANSAFWSLGPLFGTGSGLTVNATAVFMATVVIAAALAQWPLGYLSDRRDRRHVILLAGGVAIAASIALALTAGTGTSTTIALAVLFGVGAIPLYALNVAHANDFAGHEDAVDISSGLLLVYSVGAVVGPLIAAPLMHAVGARGLFTYTAAIHVALLVFVALRMRHRETPPPEERDSFVAVPRSSPVVLELDPRSMPEEEEASE
jgi:MFS family permease